MGHPKLGRRRPTTHHPDEEDHKGLIQTATNTGRSRNPPRGEGKCDVPTSCRGPAPPQLSTSKPTRHCARRHSSPHRQTSTYSSCSPQPARIALRRRPASAGLQQAMGQSSPHRRTNTLISSLHRSDTESSYSPHYRRQGNIHLLVNIIFLSNIIF